MSEKTTQSLMNQWITLLAETDLLMKVKDNQIQELKDKLKEQETKWFLSEKSNRERAVELKRIRAIIENVERKLMPKVSSKNGPASKQSPLKRHLEDNPSAGPSHKFKCINPVKGSSAGIGQAAALDFGKDGASVVIHGQSAERLDKTESLLLDAGIPSAKILKVLGSLEDPDTASKIIDQTVQKFGKIDVLVGFHFLRIPPSYRSSGRRPRVGTDKATVRAAEGRELALIKPPGRRPRVGTDKATVRAAEGRELALTKL
ncbi:short chain dehydrogenase domain-containing protein [Ditylenchus destructor]|nr:short chain dehydrogenase domain-containing protein [Ditylenchus destructor]